MARGLLPGYRAVPGSARRYVTPAGREISHREYRNRVARKAGFRNNYDLEQFRGSQYWMKWRERIVENDPSADVTYRGNLMGDARKVQAERERHPPVVRRVRGGRVQWEPNPELEPLDVELNKTPLGRLLGAAGIREGDEVWGADSPKRK